jgi:GcrA cell cycle regulator
MAWTDNRVERLKKLWAEGLSARVIAARLGGFDNTNDGGRSAVISKAHRIGLAGRKSKSWQQHGGRARSEAPARRSGHSNRPRKKPTFNPAPAPSAGPDLEIPPSERKTLMQLTPSCCRWPLGDPQKPDFHFCGRPKFPGLPYCEFHARRSMENGQLPRRALPVTSDHEASVPETARELEPV